QSSAANALPGPAAFFPPAGAEEGVRNMTGRESGIPNSSFFNKGDRPPGAPGPGIGEPVLPD
ncbi:hypothetical protein, partial [Mycobacterium sp. E787]|uniref:hypothetical protein n=1 Tax=Mycobacterium sp. E787 TaxID=1834150 RepID=UPI000AD20046